MPCVLEPQAETPLPRFYSEPILISHTTESGVSLDNVPHSVRAKDDGGDSWFIGDNTSSVASLASQQQEQVITIYHITFRNYLALM